MKATVVYHNLRGGVTLARCSSLGCFKVFSLAVIAIIIAQPAIAADQEKIPVCPVSAKGSVVSSKEYRNQSTITEICDGRQFRVLESAKADPIRKGIATDDPQATLDVNGGVKIGNDKSECTSLKAGTLRWTGSKFEGCNGSAWISLHNIEVKP